MKNVKTFEFQVMVSDLLPPDLRPRPHLRGQRSVRGCTPMLREHSERQPDASLQSLPSRPRLLPTWVLPAFGTNPEGFCKIDPTKYYLLKLLCISFRPRPIVKYQEIN